MKRSDGARVSAIQRPVNQSLLKSERASRIRAQSGNIAAAVARLIGSVAQRAASSVVEHLTFNQGVPGSIPGRPTNNLRPFRIL